MNKMTVEASTLCSSSKRAADMLDEIFDVRRAPLIPFFLTEEEGELLMGTLWDQAVAVLTSSPSGGHRALLGLSHRLRKREEQYRDSLETLRDELESLRRNAKTTDFRLAMADSKVLGGEHANIIAQFRRQVVEQVLDKYDILGYVDLYNASDSRKRQIVLTTEIALFVECDLKAVKKSENNDVGINESYTSIRGYIGTCMGSDNKGRPYGSTRLDRIAIEIGAYERREEAGNPGPQETMRAYQRFKERLAELAKHAGMTGGAPEGEGNAKDGKSAQ